MCATCGCGESTIEAHDHDHDHAPSWRIRVEQDVLHKNQRYARANRERLAGHGVPAFNLISAPGSGKTTLLARTIVDMRPTMRFAVVEGDQHTSRDAERIQAAGAPAVQVNTGKVCHLDAHMVGHAIDKLPLQGHGALFIENVGNLVCPADFDLGEWRRVVLLSVVEGDDKPVKYSNVFATADLLVLTKADLLPYVDFHVPRCLELAREANPRIETLLLSARTGEGLAHWYAWIARTRIAFLEAQDRSSYPVLGE